ncbi:MAG: Uncharacterised protein [Hyphomonas sp. TMED17]|nr:MAG: Uncharacterised protein [Hyphomonas sp. TMED17]
MPTTSYPRAFSKAATTELSTPPDIAATTRVSDGGFGNPKLFSMPLGGALSGAISAAISVILNSRRGQGPSQLTFKHRSKPPSELCQLKYCLGLIVRSVAGNRNAFHNPYFRKIVAGCIMLTCAIVPESERSWRSAKPALIFWLPSAFIQGC